jgi:hypothetical protein
MMTLRFDCAGKDAATAAKRKSMEMIRIKRLTM